MLKRIINKFDRLVVLQTKVQSKDYQHTRRVEGDLILPIGPEAMYETEINEWAFCSLGDLWSSEQYDVEKDASQKRLDELIEALNDYSRRWNPELNLEIGNYYAFQLWVIIGQIHYNCFIARCIAENLKPTKILCYTKAEAQAFMELRPDPDCIFAQILRKSGLFKAEQCTIQNIREKRKINTWRERILSALPISVREWLRKFREGSIISNTGSPAHNLLVIGGGGDWIKLNSYPAFNEVFRLHLPPKLLAARKINPTSELIEILDSAIQHEGRVPFDLKDLAIAMQTDLNLFAEKAHDISNSMKGYDAIVTAVLTFPRDNFVAHMAAVAGRPVIVWQHGEKGQSGFDPLSLYTELFYASNYFAYAPVIQKQYRPWIGKYRLANVEVVGSVEKKINWQGGDTIVYATGKWFKTAVGFLAEDPDRRLFTAHRTILNYLEGVATKRPVVFKANNTPGLNDIPYEYRNLKVNFHAPFTTLLQTAGVVILDTPATTLVEACSTKVPIFVLGGRSPYTAEFMKIVRRRVIWCDKPEELVVALAVYLSTGRYDADVNDGAFLRYYCAFKEADEVLTDVMEAVLRAIRPFKASAPTSTCLLSNE